MILVGTAMQLGTIAHQDVLDSIKLFGKEVIPNFASAEPVAGQYLHH